MKDESRPERGPLAASPEPVAEEIAAWIAYLGKPDTEAIVRLRRYSRPARVRRSVLGLAQFWGLALAAIFVPVLHFILVPALALAGPIVARSRWLERATVLDARGRCPGCDAALNIRLNLAAKPELSFRCPDCGRPLTLRIPPARIENPPADFSSPGDSTHVS